MSKKKVIFCTYSSVYSSVFLKYLLESDKVEVVAIINSTRILHAGNGFIKGSIKQILMTGWRYSAYLFLITDFFSWLQVIFGFNQNRLKTVHGMARAYQIPILDTRDVNQEESVAFICQSQANYLIAAHFNQLVKANILDLPHLKCLNVHPSLLPHFKGVDPVFYALLKGERLVGVSLHKMSESFDAGEILLQKKLLIPVSACAFSINTQLFSAGAKLVCQWFGDDSHEKKLLSCDESVPNQYDSWPTASVVKQYKNTGKCLICLRKYFSSIMLKSHKL